MSILALIAAATVYEIGTVWPDKAPPEAVFAGKSAKEVSAIIASGCMDARAYRWSVDEQTETRVVCQTPPDSLYVSLGRLSGANVTFRGLVRFSIVELNGSSRVMADAVTEETNLAGRRFDRGSGEAPARIQDFLIALGGRPANGMPWRGSDFGIRGQLVASGKPARFVLTKVDPNGAAAAAGLVPGDEVVAVAGKKLPYEQDEFRWAMAKLKPGQVWAITVIRDGKPTPVAITPREPERAP